MGSPRGQAALNQAALVCGQAALHCVLVDAHNPEAGSPLRDARVLVAIQYLG